MHVRSGLAGRRAAAIRGDRHEDQVPAPAADQASPAALLGTGPSTTRLLIRRPAYCGSRAARPGPIATLVAVASLVSFAESYRGLYLWAHRHGLAGLWAAIWPMQVDVFIAVGELALFVALVDRWAPRSAPPHGQSP